MAKHKNANNLAFYIVTALISLIIGAIVIYLIIIKTNIIPINYTSKYFQIYDASKTPTTQVYIDLARNFKFNYPPTYSLTSYASAEIDKTNFNNFILELSRGKSKIKISGIIPIGTKKSAMDYAKISNSSLFSEITDGWKYSERNVGGVNAVYSEFEMTEGIYESLLETIYGKGASNPNIIKKEQPVGYLEKKVFFKKGDIIYTISSKNIDDPSKTRAFDTVVNSFKFLY